MNRRRSGERVTYTCSRRWPGPRGARSRISVRVGSLETAQERALRLFARARVPQRSGEPAEDDPGGGPLAGAPDVLVLRGLRLERAAAR